jgi:tetratricopeptide (TPR) repeat protein
LLRVVPEPAAIQKLKAELSFAETPAPEIFHDGDYYFNTAVFYQQSRDWTNALSNYAKAAKMDAGNADIYNNMGLIYKELGQYDKAAEEFMKTVFLDTNRLLKKS